MNKLVLVYIVVLLGFGASSLSLAGTKTTYSGNSCVMSPPATIRYHWGVAQNTSNSVQKLRCPVNVGSIKGIKNAEVYVINHHGDEQLTCFLIASFIDADPDVGRNYAGNYYELISASTGSTGSAVISLKLDGIANFQATNPNLNDSERIVLARQVRYLLECNVPGISRSTFPGTLPPESRSGIVGYFIEEYD